MLMKDRSREDSEITVRQQIAYRMLAETLIGQDDNLFRIEWRPDTQMLSIQLLLAEDATLEHPKTAYEEWAYYVNSYMLRNGTESVGSKTRAPFMSRRHHIADLEDHHFQTTESSNVRMRIEPNYKLTLADNSGFFVATNSKADSDLLEKAKKSYSQRTSEWREWVEERITGKKPSRSTSSENSAQQAQASTTTSDDGDTQEPAVSASNAADVASATSDVVEKNDVEMETEHASAPTNENEPNNEGEKDDLKDAEKEKEIEKEEAKQVEEEVAGAKQVKHEDDSMDVDS